MTNLYMAAAMLALFSGLRTALRLYRERSPVVATSAVCMLASGAALFLAALAPPLSLARPSLPAITWTAAVLGLVATWAFLGTLAHVASEQARSALNFAIPATGAALAYLAQAALEGARHTTAGACLPPALPPAAADLVLMFFHCPALGRITALAWRCSRCIPVRHIRVGLRAVATAAAAELALILTMAAEVIMAACGAPTCAPVATVVGVAQGVAVVQAIVGVTVPAWSPVAVSAFRYCRAWATWCRLRPLWALLVQAAPGVQLPAQPGTRLNVRYRLHRRVIEIRDAELVLRPFRDSQAAQDAADAALSAGLPEDEHDAVIEAVMITTALNARQVGVTSCGGHDGGRIRSEPRNNLESETARLLLVSRAVRCSPIVRRAAAARSFPATARQPE
jgi:hypothetical protein